MMRGPDCLVISRLLLVCGLSTLAICQAATASAVNTSSNGTVHADISIFTLPKLPTPAEQTQCHMGECSWEQITQIDEVKQLKSEVLRAIHSRTTTAETPTGQDYPTVLDTHAHLTWKTSTSYVLCSLSRPALIWWDDETKSYMKAPLHVVSPYGYEQSAVSEYLMACHGAVPHSKAAGHPARLGYVDRTDNLPETRIADPKGVLGSTD